MSTFNNIAAEAELHSLGNLTAQPSPVVPVGYPLPGETVRRDLAGNTIDFREIPALLWNDKFEENPSEFYKQIQHLSDYLLMNGPGIYRTGFPNSRACWDAIAGRLNPRDYDKATNTYGAPGAADLKDYGFFHTVEKRLVSDKLAQPLEFSVRDMSPAASEKRRNAAIDRMAEKATRLLASRLQQEAEAAGQPADFSFLQNPDINPDEPVENLPTPEEQTLYYLLSETLKVNKFAEEAKACFKDKLVINAQVALIESDARGVYPVRVHPDRVDFIAGPGKEVRSAEDCQAIGIRDYLTFPDIATAYGQYFTGSGTIASLRETVSKLRGGAGLYYRPERLWLRNSWTGEGGYDPSDTLSGSHWNDADISPAKWQNIFYPFQNGKTNLDATGNPVAILRHRIWFKVLKYLPCKVLINGKTPDKKEWNRYLTRNFYGKMDLKLIPFTDGKKPLKSDFVVKAPFFELWEATRLGHSTLVEVRRCQHVPRYQKSIREVKFPVVMSIVNERSIVELGREFARMCNTLMMRIDEKLLLAGSDSALMIDLAQADEAEARTMLHSARKAGVIYYNSQKLADRGNPLAQLHLTTRTLGTEDRSIQGLLGLLGMLTSLYNAMIGAGDESLGQAGAYDSFSKLNLLNTQQQSVRRELYTEDAWFTNEVLQRTSEIQRLRYADTEGEWADVEVGGPGGSRMVRPVRLSKTLRQTEPVVRVEDGAKMLQIQQEIKGMAMQALPSGGASGIREFIKLLFTENAHEALRIFDEGLTELEKAQMQQAEQANQIAAQKVQVDAQKAQVPLQVTQMNNDTKLQLQQMKTDENRVKADEKGMMTDIKEQNDRERMLMQAQLEQDNLTAAQQLAAPEGEEGY